MTQESIKIPIGPGPLGPCSWCADPAVGKLEVRRGRTGTHRGRSKAVTPLEVPACRRHLKSVQVDHGRDNG